MIEYLEYILLGILFFLITLNLIIYRNKPAVTKFILGMVVLLGYLPFKFFVPILKNYMILYLSLVLVVIVLNALFFIPKKVTKNLTEYDVLELENAYKECEEEVDSLKTNFLTMIELMNEGTILYQDKGRKPLLSSKAKELFPNETKDTSLKEHSERLYFDDREIYFKTISRVSSKNQKYEIKYRVVRDKDVIWVQETGQYVLTNSGDETIIATVMPLDISIFNKTGYIIIDSMKTKDNLITSLTDVLRSSKQFTLALFELSNIVEINEKYGREVGNLMINEYIKIIKNQYAYDSKEIFRITGIRFALIITDDRIYDAFHKAVIDNNSLIYNTKIPIAEIKEIVKPKFGVVNISGARTSDPTNVLNYAEQLLKESKESTRKNYTIFGE